MHINAIGYHIYTQMKCKEYYAEIDQITDEFIRKWGYIYLDLDIIFSNRIFTFRLKCVYDHV